MADTKISALTAGAPALVTDELAAARSGANRKLTVKDLLAAPRVHSVTKNITPAGTTTWYRLGSFPAGSDGQFVDLRVLCKRVAGNGLQHFNVRLSKTTFGSGSGVTAEFSGLGLFISGGTYCIPEIRIVDAGLLGATHIDARFGDTSEYNVYLQSVDHIPVGDASLEFDVDANLTSQGTAAAGHTLDPQTTLRAFYNVNQGGWLWRVTTAGSVVPGTAALATTATDGFGYLPTCAGTPTGVPTTFTGRAPAVVDTTGSKLWVYIGGAWKSATLA
jgi:hypothetical protein